MIDLGDKLRLSDSDFDAWLEELGLLHGKRTCEACGGRTTIQNIKDRRYGNWRCTTKNCRSSYKRKFRHQAGNNTDTYRTYFPEFLWRKKFGDISHVLYNFWYHVSLFYPVEEK